MYCAIAPIHKSIISVKNTKKFLHYHWLPLTPEGNWWLWSDSTFPNKNFSISVILLISIEGFGGCHPIRSSADIPQFSGLLFILHTSVPKLAVEHAVVKEFKHDGFLHLTLNYDCGHLSQTSYFMKAANHVPFVISEQSNCCNFNNAHQHYQTLVIFFVKHLATLACLLPCCYVLSAS